MDLRKPGEEEDEYSEMAEEAMDPDNCLPDRELTHTQTHTLVGVTPPSHVSDSQSDIFICLETPFFHILKHVLT